MAICDTCGRQDDCMEDEDQQDKCISADYDMYVENEEAE